MRTLLIDFNPFMSPVTPISLGNVGAVLKGDGHEVRVISLGLDSLFSVRGLEVTLLAYRPRLVGFGAYQRNLLHIRAIAGMVKALLPEAFTVLGGPQATFLPDAGLAVMPEIDFLSRGEGELVIRAIAEAIDGAALGDEGPVPGATRRTRDGVCVTGPPIPEPGDLDGYPSPWLTGVLDPSESEESILLTARGCPNSCAFCYTPGAFGNGTRSQSVDRVLEDIAWVAKAGTGRLWFADPNFSFSHKRVVAILEGILSRGLEVQMWVETRADMLDRSLVSLMKRAGVYAIAFGLESASPNVYPGLNKGIDPERIREAVRTALDLGVDVELFSQYALPGERFADALETLAFVQDAGVQIRGNTNAQQMQLYFGAEITGNLEKYGVHPLRDDSPPYLAVGADFETDAMNRHEIEQVKSAWRAASIDGGKRVVS
jgi:anaerobic magnesium-protoporphyrin IX monomethyl ester cyclase